jgi:hypothetical protein
VPGGSRRYDFHKLEFSLPKIEFDGASRLRAYIIPNSPSDFPLAILLRETAGEVRKVDAASVLAAQESFDDR